MSTIHLNETVQMVIGFSCGHQRTGYQSVARCVVAPGDERECLECNQRRQVVSVSFKLIEHT